MTYPVVADLGIYFRIKKVQLQLVRDRGFNIDDPAEQVMLNGITDPVTGNTRPVTRDEMTNHYWLMAQQKGFHSFQPFLMSNIYYKPPTPVTDAPSTTPVVGDNFDDVEVMYVYYDSGKEKSFGKASFADFDAHLQKIVEQHADNLKNVILVLKNKPTSTAGGGRQGLANWGLTAKTVNITIYMTEELAINPTLHVFSPKHYQLTAKQKVEHTRAPKDKRQIQIYRYSSFSQPGAFPADPIVKYYGWQLGSIIMIVREIFYTRYAVRKEVTYRVVQL